MWGSTRHIITGVFTALAVSSIAVSASARTTVYSESFDSDPSCTNASNPWTGNGDGIRLTSSNVNSPNCALNVGRNAGQISLSPLLDLTAWSAIDIDVWVWENAPETGDRVDLQYQTSGGAWVTIETFERASGQNNNFSVRPAVNQALPSAAIHANSRFRFTVISASGAANDTWNFDDFVLTGTASAGPQTFIVTNTNDSGSGSLRQAISDANSNPGPDTIEFNISGSGEQLIIVNSRLLITDNDLTIDATTQAGSSCGNIWAGTNPTPTIRIDGTAVSGQTNGGNYDVFDVGADNFTLRGVAITSALRAIDGYSTSSGMTIQCSVFGIRGSTAIDNNTENLRIGGASALIGGPNVGDGNLISAALNHGIYLESGADNSVVQGNAIGLDAAGTGNLGNTLHGIFVEGASNITIGGARGSTGNIIAGNDDHGISIAPSSSSVDVLGNHIGLLADGLTALGNGLNGVDIENSTTINVGDGTSTGRNIIAGNERRGIFIWGGGVNSGISIEGNYIGTNQTGNVALANAPNVDWYIGDGVAFSVGDHTNIDISSNVIGGFPGAAVEFYGTSASNITIQGNSFGVGANGSSDIGSTFGEPLINVNGGTRNYSAFTIGGTGTGEGNIIANGGSAGIYWQSDIAGSPSIVVGNTITSNTLDGVMIQGSSSKLAVFANSIFDNGGQAVDINTDGIQPNDTNDGDGGTNDLLNFPIINSIGVSGSTTITYDITLDTVSHGEGYRVDFYRDNSSGETNGEGETWLGFVNLTYTGVTDDFTGSFTAQTTVNVGDIISAKTTRRTSGGSFDQSSEYGPNVAATAAVPLGSVDASPPGSGPGSSGDPFTSLAEAYTVPSSGQYYFNTGSGLFLGSVDTSEGGGWVLVLQYVHVGGTNPALSITGAGSNLPRFSASALGADESAESERWGHAGNAAMSQFTGDIELRWYGETSGHSRVIHFRSSVGDDYARTGSGTFNGINSGFTALTGHTANLPAAVANHYVNKADYALTQFPYWLGATYHWGVRAQNSDGSGANGNRWEVDDFPNGSGNDTIHRVWVRDADPLVVTNTNDTGEGSLRQAITVANGNAALDDITFDISGSGVKVINLSSVLPSLTDADISIDGSTQDDATCGDPWNGTPSVIRIRIDGGDTLSAGLTLAGDDQFVKGLSVVDFSVGMIVDSTAQRANLQCNYVGLVPSGTPGSNATGIRVLGADTVVGGLGAGEGNVVSRNSWGVLTSSGSTNTSILGNFIGTEPTGLSAQGNTGSGIANGSGTSTINEIRGNLISGNAFGLTFQSDDTWTGVGGADIIIAGNYIGVDRTGNSALANSSDGLSFQSGTISGARIGGTVAADRNIISGNGRYGINIAGQSDIEILGNYVGVGADGSTDLGNENMGLYLSDGASDISVGNGLASGRNIISGNEQRTIRLQNGTTNISINGNYLGTDATGNALILTGENAANSAADDGVVIAGGIFTNTVVSNNLMAGFTGQGIEVSLSTTINGLTIQGNTIGELADGTPSGTGSQGIHISANNVSDLVIGGDGSGEGNLISNSGANGINITTNLTGQIIGNTIHSSSADGIYAESNAAFTILRNSLYDNGGLGIDLNSNGVRNNDGGDGDGGTNEGLNYPVLNEVTADGTAITFDFDLDVPSNTEGYRIEFFANSSADGTGHGEGETYLGFYETGNHAGGSVNYTGSFTASQSVAVGTIISATTTRKTGASAYDITSEFAQNVTTVSAVSPLVVTNTNDSGTGSLRAAIEFANANPSEDNITFEIPNAGPHVITLASVLPTIDDDGVSIDATTQTGTVCRDVWLGTGHTLQVQIDGNSQNHVFRIDSNGVTVRGLSVTNATYGVNTGLASTNHIYQCNYFGLAPDGSVAANGEGFRMNGNSHLIGGPDGDDGNIISGNTSRNIMFSNTNNDGHTVQNNFIGPFPGGTTAPSPQGSGILNNYADNVTYERNLISGNGSFGYASGPGSSPVGNIFTNNFIGTTLTGNALLTNANDPIHFNTSSPSTADGLTIGTPGNGNVIASASGRNAIIVVNASNLKIQDNHIGVGADGTTDLSVGNHGIELQGGATGALIGGDGANEGNIIANIGANGLQISSEDVTILGNRIYNIGGTATANVSTASEIAFPTVTGAVAQGISTFSIDISANVPAGSYRFEVFRVGTDTGGRGDALEYLGSFAITHGGTGAETFSGSFVPTVSVSGGDLITATLTEATAGIAPYGATSEFATNATAVSPLVVTNINDSGTGSLRSAIEYANANASEDNITFDIPGGVSDVHTITLASALPIINDDGVVIDGTSQGDATCGDLWAGTPHTIRVRIDGGGTVTEGIYVNNANAVQINGLSVTGFSNQGVRFSINSNNTTMTCSYIGLVPDGTASGNGRGFYDRGTGSIIGGLVPGQGNVISGNTNAIHTIADGSGARYQGNFIGTDPTGTSARPNSEYGISITSGATVTWSNITRNLISGNTNHGIYAPSNATLTGLSGDVIIAGNYIGVNRTGNSTLANGGNGINFESATISGVTIGGVGVSDRNIISGNSGDGLMIDGATDIEILGNYFGLGANGSTDLGNSQDGIQIVGSTQINIGNGTANGRNIASGNGQKGLDVNNVSNMTVDENYFGTNAAGDAAVPNDRWGIVLAAPAGSGAMFAITIRNNVLSGNTIGGLDITANSHTVLGDVVSASVTSNLIGVAADGVTPLGNGEHGVKNTGVPSQTVIGGASGSDYNIIAHNGDNGITMGGNDGATLAIIGNRIFGNTNLGIDLDLDGAVANDLNDTDVGPNNLLNFPVINSISPVGTTVNYDITLDVPTHTDGYRIDFFKTSSADPSGYGEGETPLGFINVSGPGNHTGSFTATESVSQGDVITATTTRRTATGWDITSEFSLAYSAAASTELTASKSVSVFDPFGQGLYALPGNDIISSLTVTNPGFGAADADSIVLIDAVPPEMAFYNGDMDDSGPATGPVYFVQTNGANLTWTYATDARFSNSPTRPANMAGCTYNPSSGYDPNVTFVCFNPKGAMAAGDPDPTFTVQFRARIK